MTFTILGRCPGSGQLGGAVTTSDVAVGARVLSAEAGRAVAATQHSTDPRLGPALLEEIRAGRTAEEAVAAVAAATPHRDWRQIAALDARGRAAAHSGERVWPIAAQLAGQNCLAVGNMLASDRVAPAMVDAFAAASGELTGRLLAALEAGERAGGETGGLRSAAVLVVEREPFAFVDLRVDDDADPLRRLSALWDAYRPLARGVVARALDPGAAHRSSSTTTSSPSRRAG
jgi:uncharacterized Ntn-hydrolase superfamily protein